MSEGFELALGILHCAVHLVNVAIESCNSDFKLLKLGLKRCKTCASDFESLTDLGDCRLLELVLGISSGGLCAQFRDRVLAAKETCATAIGFHMTAAEDSVGAHSTSIHADD